MGWLRGAVGDSMRMCSDPNDDANSPRVSSTARVGCSCHPSRRFFLKAVGASAIAAPTISAPTLARAQSRGDIIDVHAHLTPPPYIQDLAGTDLLKPPSLQWSPAKHIEDMDRAGVTKAILSITTPGVWFGDVQKARKIARYSNDYGAQLATDHKARFGSFTALPLPDVEGSLREIEYGLDQQKSDGVALFTSYDGKWLGDPAFDPVFEELNRRKALVYIHPTSPACCVNIMPVVADAMIEYGTDTTRAIVNYVFAGAARRFPNVTMIWSHAGGTMPYLIERFDNGEKLPNVRANMPNGFRAEIRRFYYDTAQTANPITMTALKQLVPVSQIVFGTDFPFRTAAEHVDSLERGKVFDRAELDAIYRGNANRLLPVRS